MKRTKLIYWEVVIKPNENICASKTGMCSLPGLPHHKLEGVDPSSKRFWTATAETYPKPLRSLWAQCFKNLYAVRVIGNLTKHALSPPRPPSVMFGVFSGVVSCWVPCRPLGVCGF